MKRFGIAKFFQPKKKRGELDTGGEDRERKRETGEKLDKDEQHETGADRGPEADQGSGAAGDAKAD